MHTNMMSTILQEQEEARLHQNHHQPQPHDESVACGATSITSSDGANSSFPQRMWRFVRESVLLARPRRKVRSASYSLESEAREDRPRQSKKRAKSCGYESDRRRTTAAAVAAAEKEHRTAYVTATAWRKSKMLQELEASTERGRTCCMPTTAVLRDKHSLDLQIGHASERPPIRRHRATAQGKCRNCGQLFFVSSTAAAAEPPQQSAPEFCSLDCKSTFQYLRTMQSIVNERIDEEVNDGEYDNGSEETTTL